MRRFSERLKRIAAETSFAVLSIHVLVNFPNFIQPREWARHRTQISNEMKKEWSSLAIHADLGWCIRGKTELSDEIDGF